MFEEKENSQDTRIRSAANLAAEIRESDERRRSRATAANTESSGIFFPQRGHRTVDEQQATGKGVWNIG